MWTIAAWALIGFLFGVRIGCDLRGWQVRENLRNLQRVADANGMSALEVVERLYAVEESK